MKHVYIHIPFCKNICSYCDFCKMYHLPKFTENYFEALKKEDIYVRHFSKERISNYLRISIGTKEEMQTMIGFLQNFLAEG